MKQQKPYHIHFICRGNTYRSRLAAAYMHSLVGKAYHTSSSGIGTERTSLQTSEKYTQAIAKENHLRYGITTHKTQTTNQLLNQADILVFMNKDVYDDACTMYQFDSRKAIVWHVVDIPAELRSRYDQSGQDTTLILPQAERTFDLIKQQCDGLLAYVSAGSWVDITDAQNRSVDLRLPVAWANDRGLWHRGVHVIVRTSDGKYIVSKRSRTMVFAPGMLEVTLGGAVDSGELPLHSAQRETREEIGVDLPQTAFRPLFSEKQVGYHQHYHKLTRIHLYVYATTLPLHSRQFKLQPSEVSDIRIISEADMRILLRAHRLQHFGRLKWGYKLYAKAVVYSSMPL